MNKHSQLPTIQMVNAYQCGTGNCGDGQCVHQFLPNFCPECSCQLVHVTTNGVVFCSNDDDEKCGWDSHINNVANFHSLTDALEHQKQQCLNRVNEFEASKASKWRCYNQRLNRLLLMTFEKFCEKCGKDTLHSPGTTSKASEQREQPNNDVEYEDECLTCGHTEKII